MTRLVVGGRRWPAPTAHYVRPAVRPKGVYAKSSIKVSLDYIGAPGEIRTPDPQIRSLVLYPAELRALCASAGQ